MIMWLDHRIFGNGYGLKSPYFDDQFYWLKGELYTWNGGFGSQLQSFQWRHPKPGDRRQLLGREFRAFQSNREFWWLWKRWVFAVPLPICRVRVSWACSLPAGIDGANAELRQMQKELERL